MATTTTRRKIFSDPQGTLMNIVILVMGGLFILALVSTFLTRTASGVEFGAPTAGGIANAFGILIIGAAIWIAYTLLLRWRVIEKKQIFLVVAAVVILYFVYTKLSPGGLEFMAVRLMSVTGMG